VPEKTGHPHETKTRWTAQGDGSNEKARLQAPPENEGMLQKKRTHSTGGIKRKTPPRSAAKASVGKKEDGVTWGAGRPREHRKDKKVTSFLQKRRRKGARNPVQAMNSAKKTWGVHYNRKIRYKMKEA